MNIIDEIMWNLDSEKYINEMAQKELQPVVKMIEAGDIEAAVEKYRELGGKPGGVTRTVNSYLAKNPNANKENFNKFLAAFSKIKAQEDEGKEKRQYKSTKTGKTKEGETVEAGGQSMTARKKRAVERIEKEEKKIDKEEAILKKGSEEELRQLAKTLRDDIADTDDKERKIQYEILDDFVKGDDNVEEAKQAMKDILESGRLNLEMMKYSSSKMGDIKPTEKIAKKKEEQYKKIEAAKKAKDKKVNDIKEEILKESMGYEGNMFWENYMLSSLVKTFSKDLKELGEDALDLYVTLYGEETKPLFDIMIENENDLHEAAKISGMLLFEGVGEKNVNAYLNEVNMLTPGSGGVGIMSLLKMLWSKLKYLGGGILGNIGAFLKSGFGWAKDLISQGAAWVAKTPILNVAIPMLMVTGSIAAAKALINKLRKKAGKKKMTPEEEEKLKKVAEKNEEKIEKARQKVLKKAS